MSAFTVDQVIEFVKAGTPGDPCRIPSTIYDLKLRNHNAGFHYFEPSTMRFFASRVSDEIWPLPDGSALFVTSEKFKGFRAPDGPRLYSIRIMFPDGSVDTVGEFQQFKTSGGAKKAAQRISDRVDREVLPRIPEAYSKPLVV